MKCIESINVYGGSGTGKTHQCGELAMWVNVKGGKKLRLVSVSGGGWTPIQPHVDSGIVEPTYIRDRAWPFYVMEKMAKGWWPADPQDPLSPLIPPKDQKDWKDVGAVAFDGLSEACDWLMSTSVAREAAGEIRISQESLSARFTDGNKDTKEVVNVGTPGRAHYLVIQNAMTDYVSFSRAIPDVFVLWTALELRATDDVTKLPIYGPQVSGKAKTSDAAAWFEDTLHLTGVIDSKGKTLRRLWLQRHIEPDDSVPYLAKVRANSLCPLPPYLEAGDCSLYKFLDLLYSSQEKAKDLLTQKINQLKGQS